MVLFNKRTSTPLHRCSEAHKDAPVGKPNLEKYSDRNCNLKRDVIFKHVLPQQDSGDDSEVIELHLYKSMTSGILVKIDPDTMLPVNQVGKCFLRGRPVQQVVDEGRLYFYGKLFYDRHCWYCDF